ncbi:MAG: SurA N-terminal domain-containing protein [Deltaproteobacteria bacterium]|nr:SurA N-terminal domain-containing protein [Deltaproteobacteria bacterium]
MLESIRKRRNSIVILVAFAAIIVVFIFWGAGPSNNDNQNKTAVAIVDGVEIPVREYAALYKKELDYYRTTFKGQFTEEVARKMDLKHRSLDILINRALALKDADAKGVKVATEDIQAAIRSIPAFTKNGAFDKETYIKVLNANRISPSEFEKSIEDDILTGKVRETVVKDLSVTDDEVKAAYKKEMSKVNLSYAAFDGDRLKSSIKVTDEEGQAFLKTNGSAFMVPVKIKAFYAFIGYKDAAAKAKATDEDVKAFYEKNKDQFALPERVKARHILVRPAPDAADAEKAKADARAKLEDIIKKIKAGAKFADMAKKHSDDPGSAKVGGDLGEFGRGVMIKPFEETAFALKKGEMSGTIETEFGYHVILVEDKKDPSARALSEVSADIRKNLNFDKARSFAKDSASLLGAKMKDMKTVEEMKKAASEAGLKATVTEPFSDADKRIELVSNEMLRDVVFGLRAGEVSPAVETHEGVYVIKAVEKVDSHVPEYKDVSARVKAMLILKKADETAKKKAEELLAKAKGGADLAVAAKAEGVAIEETGLFSKSQGFVPKIGAFSGDKPALFDLTDAAPYYPEVLEANGRYYVLKLKATKEADETAFESMKEPLKARLKAQKQEDAVSAWLKDLRTKAKIKVFEDML